MEGGLLISVNSQSVWTVGWAVIPHALYTNPRRFAQRRSASPRPAPPRDTHTLSLPALPPRATNELRSGHRVQAKANIGKEGEKYVVPQHVKQAAREMTDTSTLNRISDDIATISAAAMIVAADKATDIAQSQKQWLCAYRCCLDCAHPQFQISNNQTTDYRLVWCCAWSSFTIVLNVNIMHQLSQNTKLRATN